MTRFRKTHMVAWAAASALALVAVPCFAAEGGGLNRHTWDLAMRVINFAILAFVIYKYGKAPLVKFLADKRNSVVVSFEDLERERNEFAAQQEEQNRLFAQMDEKINTIRSYYHQLGQDERERILARAEIHREHLLEDAQVRADREFEKARAAFRQEVVEMAVEMAEERIRGQINDADQKNLIEGYVNQLSTVTPSAGTTTFSAR